MRLPFRRVPAPSAPKTPPNLSTASKENPLRSVRLFASLATNDLALQKIHASMQEQTFAPHTDIIRQGDSGDTFFVLISGQAVVSKRTPSGDEYKVVILHSEMRPFFGEAALINADLRSATIRAVTECHCLVLNRKAFDAFCESHPGWALPLYKQIASEVLTRLSKTSHDLMLLHNALVSEVRGEG